MEILKIIVLYYLVLLGTWIFYLALTNLQRHRNDLSDASLFFGKQVLFIGALLDFTLNIMMTIPFMQVPRELVLTDRLKRNISDPGYRGKLSRWICKELLNRFDPTGKHC